MDIVNYEGNKHQEDAMWLSLQHQYPTPELRGIVKDPVQKARLDWLVAHTSGDNILEVGTCSGYVIHSVPGKYKVGLDNSEIRLKLASWEFDDEALWVLGTATKLPFEDKEFDTVILAEILEHLSFEDAKIAFSEAIRVGKRVIITVPKSTSYISINHEHMWECTEAAVVELLKSTDCFYTLSSSFCDNFWFIEVK